MHWNLAGMADAASRLAMAFQAAPEGLPGRVWAQLGPWTQRLLVNASEKWLPRLMTESVCDVPNYRGGKPAGPCYNQGLVQCDVCQRVCCLDHCRIDQHGDGICYICILNLIQSSRSGAPGHAYWGQSSPSGGNGGMGQSEADRAATRAAYKLLGVPRDATDEQLKAALREKLSKWHPDRHRGDKAKARAEAKFKEVSTAYDVIMKARKRGVAA